MFLKLTLAAVALATAILSVLDLPSLKQGHEKKWLFRKLSIWGYLKVLAAVLTFVLIALIEKSSQVASVQADLEEEKLREEIRTQGAELMQARDALGRLVDESVAFRQSFDLFERAIRGIYVYYSTVSVNFDGRVSYDLDYVPVRNDKIEWRMNCFTQSLPQVATCPSGSFGYLIANGEKTPLVSFTGSYVFRGTASTGGSLSYEAPTADCRELRYELEKKQCEVVIDVQRTGENIQLDLLNTAGGPEALSIDFGTNSAICRAYEILYGGSCSDIARQAN
jgi:hypothetical protein